MPGPMSQYEIPPFNTSTALLHGWLCEAVQEGDAWLAAQRPASEWPQIIDALGVTDPTDELTDQSNTCYPKDKRIARELVASISNFRHEGEFKVQWDQSLYDRAHALTKRDRDWYRSTFAYDEYRKGIQYAVGLGTTYFCQEWDKAFHGDGHGDVRLEALAPDAVTFVQLPPSHDMQLAYIVLIRHEYPINLAKRLYLQIAHLLTADRDNPAWVQKGLQKIQKLLGGSPVARFFAGTGPLNQTKTNVSYPLVDIYHAYILDNAHNETGHPITMGAKDTNWEYIVPSLGDEIPTGIMNPATGAEFTRPAEPADCLLFPLRRLCIFSKSTAAIAYDGSSPWWHGRAPIERIRFSDWPWEALGQSLVGDVRSMRQGVESIMRGIDDSVAATLDPARIYNEAAVDEGFAQAFNPRKAGSVAAANFDMGDVIKFPLPPGSTRIEPMILQYVKDQEARMDYITAVQDLTAIAKAKQIPSSDALEKILEMAGPLTQDIVRSLERPLWSLGEMRKALYFQFDTRKRMLTLLGPDAEDGEQEDFEYGPELIVPLMAGETLQARRDRAKRSMHEFHYHLTSHAISELHRLSNKLFWLQLMKIGFPISWFDYARIAEIPNFGPDPDGTKTGMERWIAQKHIQAELAQELGGGQQGQKGAGRPASNQKAPQLATKDQGTRSTVKTS